MKLAASVGLKPEEFWAMGPVEFRAYVDGCRLKSEVEDNRSMILAKSIRTMTYLLYNIQLAQKDRISEPQDLWFLPGDESLQRAPKQNMTKTQGKAIAERYKQLGIV